MRIMCDTNIIIDVLMQREPFYEDSYKLLSLCEQRKVTGLISAAAVTDIFYMVRKYTHSTEMSYQAIGRILDCVRVCDVTNADVLKAYQIHAKDFEDCLMVVCAMEAKCKYIVTRNKKDYDGMCITAVTPAEFLETVI